MAETKKQELAKVKKQNERLMRMVAEEREKVRGYKEIAKVHSAYISILLNRLGATKDNMACITAGEVKEAIEKFEARAMLTEDGFGLYCEVVAGE